MALSHSDLASIMGEERIARFWSLLDKESDPNGCWLWTKAKRRRGYGQFKVKGKSLLAHRIAWELTYGPIPDGLRTCHHCDQPSCANPEHLWLGTDAENIADRDAKGRANPLSGEQNAQAKLSSSEVKEIRSLYKPGSVKQKDLGEIYKVSNSQISLIVRGKSRTKACNEAADRLLPVIPKVMFKGELNGRAKLTLREVREIRALYSQGEWSYQDLGEMFGVKKCQIGRIIRNEMWVE